MNVEQGWNWPLVEPKNMTANVLDGVLETTSRINDYFDPKLPDNFDLTIRTIVHVIMTEKEEGILWYFDGWDQKERFLQINQMIMTASNVGLEQLKRLVDDFNQQAHDHLKTPRKSNEG